MPPPLLPAPAPRDDNRRPDEAEDSGTGGRGRGGRQNQTRRHVASEEDCLAILTSLGQLVALGILSTSRANTIRSVYAEILRHYQRQSPTERSAVADDDLIEMLTRHPEYANMLEPLLSAEQIAAILARATEGSHGPA